MKKRNLSILGLLMMVSFGLLISCTKDNEAEQTVTNADVQGKWDLVKMTGGIPGSETTGTAMEWQESYLINVDGNFTKIRTRNGITTQLTGSYTISENSENNILQFNYFAENEIINSCISVLQERLVLTTNDLMKSTWEQCDGSGLEFNKEINK